jgi:hypothetical protein
MAALGPQNLGYVPGGGYSVLAHKIAMAYKAIGVTIDWTNAGVSINYGTNAEGTLVVTAGSGNVTYTYGGQTTGNVAYNADAATIEAALEGLSSIGNGNIVIAGTAPNFTYELVNDLAKTARSTFTSTGATITATQAGTADAVKTLPGGFTVPIGEKYIPAGSVLYKLGGGKYGVAVTGTTLVRGECFVNDSHIFESLHTDQVGPVFDNGTALLACLQIDGTGQVTKSAFLTAFPAIRLHTDV